MTKTSQDALFLRRCFDIAQRGIGLASPNPSVGAVIVAQNRIIGEGHTQVYGQAHAEVMAVAAVAETDRFLLSEATLYVTLEPCFHYGKTPPCVNLVLTVGIPRVVMALQDPFEAVAGKSIEKMRAAGIEVVVYPLNSGWPELPPALFVQSLGLSLAPFLTQVRQQRPYIILKWAQTADGYMGHAQERLLISNAVAQRLVHKWRSESDAIMVGTETALRDNPRLDNRLFWGKNPLRVVIDRSQRLPQHLHIYTDGQPTRFYTSHTPPPSVGGLEWVHLAADTPILPQILTDLRQNRIGTLFVEGGSALLKAFIEADLWDEARVFNAETVFLSEKPDLLRGGIAAPCLPPQSRRQVYQILDNQLFIYENKAKMSLFR